MFVPLILYHSHGLCIIMAATAYLKSVLTFQHFIFFSIFFVKNSMAQFPQWDIPFGSSDREETALGLEKPGCPSFRLQEQLNVPMQSQGIYYLVTQSLFDLTSRCLPCQKDENTAWWLWSVRKQVALIVIFFACSLIEFFCVWRASCIVVPRDTVCIILSC